MDWQTFCMDRRWEALHVGCCNRSELTVCFSSEFNRKACPSTDAAIEEKWQTLVSGNQRLFNGQKFRLNSIRRLSGRGDTPRVSLELGLTDYKTAMCTNHNEDQMSLEILWNHGLEAYSNKQACFADPIAVNVVLTTRDEKIVLIRRADWVGEAKGLLDVPGGHAEPQEIIEGINIADDKMYDEINKDQIVHELFHSMVREIRDELNVPEESIAFPTMTGIMRNKDANGKPCFSFKTSCDLSSEEILRKYSEGGLETDESSELMFIPLKELDLLDMNNKWTQLFNQVAPCGQGAIYMSFLGS